MKCYRDDSYRTRIISFMLIFIGLVKGYSECPIGEYQCFNGDCIRGDYFCDFVPDCSDNSDETFCYLECTYAEDLRGAKYRGKRNITKSGRPCQRYDQQSPHAHSFGYLGTTSENYCRNDDNSPGPWCYTLDPDVRWEVCATPRCTEYKLGNCNFETGMCDWRKSRDSIPWNRQDNWMDDTEGKKILLMDLTMDSPTNYSLFLSPVVIPTYDLTCFGVSYYTYGSGVQDIYIYVAYGMNELKLVSSSRDIRENIWHHTMTSISEQIQYGIVMRAEISDFDTGGIAIGDLSLELGICPGLDLCSTSQYQCDDWTCIDVHKFCDGVIDCPDSSDELNCQFHCLPEYDLRGLLYRGEINATKSGRVCQRWDTQEPQGHSYYWEQENYCRNPDNDEEPWCYTVDPDIRFEFCSVPRCDYDCLQKDDTAGTYYRGHLNVSSSGRQCQRWDQQIPHSHSYTKFSTEENYCRNDGVDLTIWCYTIDPDVRWEYCHLPICEPSKCRQDDSSCLNSQKQEQSTESGRNDLVTDDGSCLSGFLCRDTDVCLERLQVCDGIYHCPHHDDEAMCNISCPVGCFCNGSILNCSISYAGVGSFPKNIRVLRLSGDQFTLDMLFEAVLPFLIHLNISYTQLVSIGHEDIFEIQLQCSNLQSLYLGHNKIATISRYVFARLTQLRELHLNGNPILTLQPHTFNQLQSVNYLSITESPLKSILDGIFIGLINIKTLNLDSNKLETIDSQSLQSLREITNIYLSNNNLTALSQYFSSKMTQLVVLDLRHNHIQNITSSSLEGLYYLEQLDLSSNEIQIMPQNAFIFLQALLKLNLSHNMISRIESGAFEGLVSLQSLDLEGNKLEYISAGSLRGLKSVTFINLNSNSLHQIEPQTFTDVGELSVLYLKNNRLTVYKEMFYGLCKLKTIHADTYRVCCAKPPSVLPDNCVAPVDTISSCDHLIDVGLLSISIWFIAVFTLGGNVFVVIYRFSLIRKRKSSPHIIFILNLSISDFVMGIYLMIIAVADLQFRGDYGYNDLQWRHSTTCTVSGVMATVSSETSAILLFVITIDRLFALKFPFSKFRFTFKSSIYISITVWLLAGVLAILPLIFFDSYYALSSVCISLPLSTIQEVGRGYSMGLFIFFNLALFLGIVAGQLLIYLEVRHVEKHTNKDKSNEAAVARTLITLAMTDALCWIPIAILGILTQIGIEVSSTVYAWVIVLVLPINSAINPFLYTFSAIRSKRIRKHTKSEIYSKSSLTYVSTKRRNIDSLAEVRVVPDHRPQTLCLADCPKHHSLSLAEIYTIVERIVQDLQMFHLKNLIHSSISEENIFICLDKSSATGKKRNAIRDVWLSSKDDDTVNADRHRDMYALGELISCLLAEHPSW